MIKRAALVAMTVASLGLGLAAPQSAEAATGGCGRTVGENMDRVDSSQAGFTQGGGFGPNVRIWAEGLQPGARVIGFGDGKTLTNELIRVDDGRYFITVDKDGKVGANLQVSGQGSRDSSGYYSFMAMGADNKVAFRWNCAIDDEANF